MSIGEIISGKRSAIEQLAARYGVGNLRIFGSVARGDAGPDSDLDLLVELAPGMTLLRHAAFERELQELLGRKVHVVSERGLRPRVRERMVSEAVPL
jgi:hypothetical protein